MKREAVFQRADLLPVLPRVIQDLLASFHDDNLPIDALVSRIASDQGLSAKLLRVANSAYFEVPFTVATVAGAVSMLGFVNVRALVISQGLLACFKDAPGLDPQQLWVHNMQVAGAARHLGARLGLNAELAFACGLLHTVGEAVLHLAMPAEMRVFDQGIALLAPHRAAAQRHAFGYTQAEIGGELALRWNFPTLLVQAIAGSDEPLAQSEWSPLAATLHLADWFVRAHGAGLTQQALRNAWPNSVAERLAWADHDALDQLIAWAGVQRH
jgi:HD-like signal output (HDOD) protein